MVSSNLTHQWLVKFGIFTREPETMAATSRDHIDSIKGAEHKHATIREATQDFLIRASQILGSDLDEGPLIRYYRLRINSLLDPYKDKESIEKLQSTTSKQSTTCIKCGNPKKIKLKPRRSQNRSWTRRYCRYLRSFLIIYCDKCFLKTRHTLQGRQSLLDELSVSKNTVNNKRKSLEGESESIATPKKKVKLTPTPTKPQHTKVSPTTPKRTTQTAAAVKQIKRTVKGKNLAVPSVQSKKAPQFSSRLRAFTCLLKK